MYEHTGCFGFRGGCLPPKSFPSLEFLGDAPEAGGLGDLAV